MLFRSLSSADPTDDSTPEPTPFNAPTFTGRSLDEAQDLASSGGLELDITYDTTTNEPDGTVLSQVPEPGTEVLPGDQIFLVVAQPGPTVLVPDVVGVPAEDALNLLIDSDLRPGEVIRRPLTPDHGHLRNSVGTEGRHVARALQSHDPRLGEHPAQVAGILTICRNDRARMKAARCQCRGKAVIRNRDAAFDAIWTHRVKRVPDPERHDDDDRRNEHDCEGCEFS